MDAISKARSAIEDRLKEIRNEEKRLEGALKHLVGADEGQPKTRRANSSRGRSRTRKRAARGQREKQLLASIKAHPNYKQADHAKEIGISSNQVYGLVSKMSKAKQVKKNKDGTLKAIG